MFPFCNFGQILHNGGLLVGNAPSFSFNHHFRVVAVDLPGLRMTMRLSVAVHCTD